MGVGGSSQIAPPSPTPSAPRCHGACFNGLSMGSTTREAFKNSAWVDPQSAEYAAVSYMSQPIRVAVAGAAGQIGYALLPMIASGEMFGQGQRVILQCLDLNLPQVLENMKGLEMELVDGNFPLLQEAFFTVDDAKAFKDADYAILLGAFPQQEGREKVEVMEKNTMIFRTLGRAIETHASNDCKVLTVGHPSCTNALLCAYHAPLVPKENFFGLTRLEHNRAIGQIASRTGVNSSEVRNIAIWGAVGVAGPPDIGLCTVRGKPLNSALHKDADRQWLEQDFPSDVQARGATIQKVRRAACALSSARAISASIRDIHCGTRPGEFVSMGVWSDDNKYGIAPGLIFSMPVIFEGKGRHRIASGLQPAAQCRQRIEEAEKELISDRDITFDLARKHGFHLGNGHN